MRFNLVLIRFVCLEQTLDDIVVASGPPLPLHFVVCLFVPVIFP